MSAVRYQFTKEELQSSPSTRDGFTSEQESLWRRRYCRLVEKAAASCETGYTALQTAIFYLHHYYAIKSMASNDPLIMVTAALYLACKVEEQPRSLTRVTQTVYSSAYAGRTLALKLIMKQEIFLTVKQRVLKAERALLYALGFNLEVKHPSLIAVNVLQEQYNAFLPEGEKVSPEEWAAQCKKMEGHAFQQLNQLCFLMWRLGCLSFQIPSYLHYNPSHIAAACIYVAIELMQLKVKPEKGWYWWDQAPLQCPFPMLTELCREIMRLLGERGGSLQES